MKHQCAGAQIQLRPPQLKCLLCCAPQQVENRSRAIATGPYAPSLSFQCIRPGAGSNVLAQKSNQIPDSENVCCDTVGPTREATESMLRSCARPYLNPHSNNVWQPAPDNKCRTDVFYAHLEINLALQKSLLIVPEPTEESTASMQRVCAHSDWIKTPRVPSRT